jgi:uncharacterized membrane protein
MSDGRGSEAVAAEAAETEMPKRRDPVIRKIRFDAIGDAFAAGLRDFQAAPQYGLFFGGVYAFGGMIMVAMAAWWDMLVMVYPLAAGFALIGPFVAVGLYEVSRLREAGLPLSWSGVLGAVFAQSRRELGWMAFVTLFVFIMWMYQIRLLTALFFGLKPISMHELLPTLIATPEGWLFLLIGHVDGAILSLVLFSLTVVSFPLLLDREVDFITAMITSVRSVTANPGPMIGWAAVVVILLIVAAMPFFLGLFIALPVLGHTTWHLYRRLVEPEAQAG